MNRIFNDKVILRKLISVLFSFALMIGIVLIGVSALLGTTVLSPDYMMKQMEKSGYLLSIEEKIESDFISYGMSGGLDEEFFHEAGVYNNIRSDMFLEINRVFDPLAPGPDYERFRNNLYIKIMSYIAQQDIEITDEIDEAIVYLVELCLADYAKMIGFPLTSILSGLAETLRTLIWTFGIIGIALIVISIIVIIKLWPGSWKKSAFPYWFYSLCGSALFFAFISMYITLSGRIEKIVILDKAFYSFVTMYANGIFELMLLFAVLPILILLILSINYRRRLRLET